MRNLFSPGATLREPVLLYLRGHFHFPPNCPDGCCCSCCFCFARAAVAAGRAARAGGAVFRAAGLPLLFAHRVRWQNAGPARHYPVSGRRARGPAIRGRDGQRSALDEFHVLGYAHLPHQPAFSGRLVGVPAKGPHAGPARRGGQPVSGAALRLRAAGGAGAAAAHCRGGRGGAGLFELQPRHSGRRPQHQEHRPGLRAAGARRPDCDVPPRQVAGRGAVRRGPHAQYPRQPPANHLLPAAAGRHFCGD